MQLFSDLFSNVLNFTWQQGLMQRPWRTVAYWFALRGLFCLLSYRTQDHQPRGGLTHNRLGPLTLTNNHESTLKTSITWS